jgi:DNA-binding response OmpR family regulator
MDEKPWLVVEDKNVDMRVLIIEDDGTQAETLARLLRKTTSGRWETSTAGTFTQGVALSNSLRPAITILDLCLPDMPDTPEMPGWMRVAHGIPTIHPPVIVITGLDDPDKQIKFECYRYGAQNVFAKGIDNDLLVTHLVFSLESALLRRELGPATVVLRGEKGSKGAKGDPGSSVENDKRQ